MKEGITDEEMAKAAREAGAISGIVAALMPLAPDARYTVWNAIMTIYGNEMPTPDARVLLRKLVEAGAGVGLGEEKPPVQRTPESDE